MNTPLPHRIRRLHWQARAPTPDAAFALRSLLREGGDAVLAALERSLSAQVSDTRLIPLPRLELHLQLKPTDSADELSERVFAAAAAAIAEALAGLDTGAATGLTPEFATEFATDPATPAPAQNVASQAPPSNVAAPLPVAAALALDALCRSAPAELHAAIATALTQAGIDIGAPPDPLAPPIALRLRDQLWLLPPAALYPLFIELGTTLAADPAPRHASTQAAPTTRPAADPASPTRAGKLHVPNPVPNPAPSLAPTNPADALPLHAQASLPKVCWPSCATQPSCGPASAPCRPACLRCRPPPAPAPWPAGSPCCRPPRTARLPPSPPRPPTPAAR